MKKPAAVKTVRRYNAREKVLGIFIPRACPLCGEPIGDVPIDEELITRLRIEAGAGPETTGAGSGASETRVERRDAPEAAVAGITGENPYICPDCYKQLDLAQGQPRCLKCSRPLDEDTEEYCIDCRRKERLFDRGAAVMMHNEAARKILYDLKYGNMKDNVDFLGYEAACRLAGTVRRMEPDVLIPVPLHGGRLRKRGYNQAQLLAERFCLFMELAGFGKLDIDTEYLVRTGRTLPLKGMSGSERAASLRNAFTVAGETGRYRKVLLVDDIFTTGSTLNECAKTLRQAGVNMVYFMTASIGS